MAVRVLSKKRHEGMDWVLRQKEHYFKSLIRKYSGSSAALDIAVEAFKGTTCGDGSSCLEEAPASSLLLHIHGGGFVALSAETHDVSFYDL